MNKKFQISAHDKLSRIETIYNSIRRDLANKKMREEDITLLETILEEFLFSYEDDAPYARFVLLENPDCLTPLYDTFLALAETWTAPDVDREQIIKLFVNMKAALEIALSREYAGSFQELDLFHNKYRDDLFDKIPLESGEDHTLEIDWEAVPT